MANYYIDANGNYYIDTNGNYYIHSEENIEVPYFQYKANIFNGSKYNNYVAYIYKNGSYVRVKPYIATEKNMAIAGVAIAGSAIVG